MLMETEGQGRLQQDAPPDNLPEPQTNADDQTECGVESTRCANSAYVTVTYVTGHRSFWLLTEKALSNIETSASQLKAAASKTEAHQRIEALQALGLADLFVPPTPKSFLPAGQQSEWEQLLEKNQRDQESIDKLDLEIAEAERLYKDKARALKTDVDYYVRQMPLHHDWRRQRDEKEQAQHDLHNAIDERNERIEGLSEIGTNAAKAAGFIVSGGELFSPKQIELKALLDDYDRQRQAFEEDNLPNADQTAIFLNT